MDDAKIPGLGGLDLDYGEHLPTPPRHHHRGPWLVYQAFDPARWAKEDRWAAACALRPVSYGPVTAEQIEVARNALDVAKSMRAAGRDNDTELCLRALLGDEKAFALLARMPG